MLSFPFFSLLCRRDSKYSRKLLLSYKNGSFPPLWKSVQIYSSYKRCEICILHKFARYKLAGLCRIQISWRRLPDWPTSSPGNVLTCRLHPCRTPASVVSWKTSVMVSWSAMDSCWKWEQNGEQLSCACSFPDATVVWRRKLSYQIRRGLYGAQQVKVARGERKNVGRLRNSV